MGQQSAHTQHPTPILQSDYTTVTCDRQTGTSIILSNGCTYLLRQISTTEQLEFDQLTESCRHRKSLTGHEHYLGLKEYREKVQPMFCSKQFVLTMVYEYAPHSLQQEVEARFGAGRGFGDREIWSILCSCSMALGYLHRNGLCPELVTPQDIRLTEQGIIKLMDGECRCPASDRNYLIMKRNHYYCPQLLTQHKPSSKSCIFSLGMCILQAMFLEPINDCYNFEEATFNEKVFEGKIGKLQTMKYSKKLVEVVTKMLKVQVKERVGVLELEAEMLSVGEMEEQEQEGAAEEGQGRGHDGCELSGVVEQKTGEGQDEEVLNQGIQPMEPQAQPADSLPIQQAQSERQLPDQDDPKDDQPAPTDRSIQNCRAIMQLKSKRHEASPVSIKQTSLINPIQIIITPPKDSPLKLSNPSNLSSQRVPLSDFTQNLNKHNQHLFTDPKLLALLKEDVVGLLEYSKEKKNQIGKRNNRETAKFNIEEVKTTCVRLESSRKITEKENDASHRADLNCSIKNNISATHPQQNHHTFSKPCKQHHHHTFSKSSKETDRSLKFQPPQPQSPPPLTYVTQTYTRGRYQGQKLNDQRHGYGTFYYKQGGKYSGEWKQNKMHGKGTLFYCNNKIAYEGDWKEDKLWGDGVLYNEEPKMLATGYDYTSWDEVDEFWTKYEGRFVEDNKEGHGKLYLTNGEVFVGNFEGDEVNGEGCFYRRDKTVFKGRWKNNQLVVPRRN